MSCSFVNQSKPRHPDSAPKLTNLSCPSVGVVAIVDDDGRRRAKRDVGD